MFIEFINEMDLMIKSVIGIMNPCMNECMDRQVNNLNKFKG